MPQYLHVREEAAHMLELHGGSDRLGACLQTLSSQFMVIQGRSQLLLTLATIMLTITGFSGPRIADSGQFARYGLSIGLVFVLGAVIVILMTLRIRWLTQFQGEDPESTLIRILEYRNGKSRWFTINLILLVVGLTCYVAAVIAYLLSGVGTYTLLKMPETVI